VKPGAMIIVCVDCKAVADDGVARSQAPVRQAVFHATITNYRLTKPSLRCRA
jgi:hypothetical protein